MFKINVNFWNDSIKTKGYQKIMFIFKTIPLIVNSVMIL